MLKLSLSEKYPEIAKEWHPNKNGQLTPDNVTPGASQKVWWLCQNGHEFEQRIRYHVISQRCPKCSGRKVSIETSLATLFPEIAKEWHLTKNGNLKPTDFTPGSKIKVWWQCPKHSHHVYPATIHQRTKHKTKCPICKKRARAFENSLMNLYPELIKEWDFEKNLISPDTVGRGSLEKVWWKCITNPEHQYEARIFDRVRWKNCPKCFPITAMPHTLPLLIEAKPELLKEWNYKKNGKLDPTTLTLGSNRSVYWICSKCENIWKAPIRNRARYGRGCPKCNKRIANSKKSLNLLFPDIAKEWHPNKNLPLTPEEISYGSGEIVWWLCPNGHSWKAMIRDRTKINPSTCPKCKEKTSLTLAEEFPEIAKEWHPQKNLPLTPSSVTSKSNIKVWWVCKINPLHEWQAEIKNRTILKSGCWHCYKERADVSTTKVIIDSIISNSAFYKNYKLGIGSIIKLLEIKIWDRSLKLAFRRMIYANIVTLLEAYLADTFIKTVLDDAGLIRKFVENTPKFQEEKITISNIYSWMETSEKKIKEDLLDITYHNIWKVQKMYNSVLGITFSNNIETVQKIINIRHDLVHRSGKTKEGKTINIDIHDIKKAIDNINIFVQFIEKQHSEKYSNNQKAL